LSSINYELFIRCELTEGAKAGALADNGKGKSGTPKTEEEDPPFQEPNPKRLIR
jgi:hypothetical protein